MDIICVSDKKFLHLSICIDSSFCKFHFVIHLSQSFLYIQLNAIWCSCFCLKGEDIASCTVGELDFVLAGVSSWMLFLNLANFQSYDFVSFPLSFICKPSVWVWLLLTYCYNGDFSYMMNIIFSGIVSDYYRWKNSFARYMREDVHVFCTIPK